MKTAYCPYCKSQQEVRENRTQYRCKRCATFLGRKAKAPEAPRQPEKAA